MDQDKNYKNTVRDVKRKVKSVNKSIDKENDLSFKKFSKRINKTYKSLADKQFELIDSINNKLNKSFKKATDALMSDNNSKIKDMMNKFNKLDKKITNKAKAQGKLFSTVINTSIKKEFDNLGKSATETFSKISKEGSKMTTGLSKNIKSVTEDLRDWSTALNVSSLAGKVDDATKSMREYRIEMSKKGISKDTFRDLENYAEQISSKSGYTIDKSDLMDAMSEVVSKGYKNPDDIKMYGELYQKFKYLGGDIDSFREVIDTFKQSGFGGADGAKSLVSAMMSLQNSDLGVSIEQLSETLKEFNEGKGGFRSLANGDKSLYDKYINGAMALTASASSNGMDGLDKALLSLMKMDPESIADAASQNNAGWLIEVQKQMRSGDMKAAAANFLQNYNKQRAQMLANGGQDAWLTFSKEMNWGDLRDDQISDQAHINAFMKDLDKANQVIDSDRNATNKYIDTMEQQVSLFDRFTNFFKSNPITSKISDAFDDLDISFTELLFMLNQGSELFGKIGGGLGKVFGKLGGNKAVEGGLGKILGKVGMKGAAKFIPGVGLISTALTGADAVKQVSTGDREQQWQGGTKLALTGIGGAVGAIFGGPIGAQVGAGIGSLIADAVGDYLGSALMKGWDSATTFLSTMSDSLGKVASDFWNGFTDLAKNVGYTVIGLADMAMETIFNALGLDWGSFKETVSGTIDYFTQIATSAWDTLYEYASSIWESLTSVASGFWDSVTSFASNAWNSIGKLASGIFDSIKSALANSPLGVLIKGVSAIVGKVSDVLSSANERGKTIVDGSHKDGLETVPKDGYIAELHKNEAVLTSQQADQWRAMQDSNNSTTTPTVSGNPDSFFHKVYQSALSNYDKNAMIASYKASVAGNKGGGKNGNYGSMSTQDRLGIWKFFRGIGYSKEATAGIMGNLSVESGGTYSPSIVQNNGAGPAAGIAQWENYNTKSDRWENLNNYALSKSKSWDDLQTQLEFIDRELQGADPTTLQKLNDNYGGYEGFKQMNDVAQATSAFLDSFERAGVTADSERLQAATENYNDFNQYKQGTPWVPNDQVALLHKGEMVVPSDNNPYNSSSSSVSDDSSLSEVIDTLVWGIKRLESAIKESSNQPTPGNYNLSNYTRNTASESDSVFRFANP